MEFDDLFELLESVRVYPLRQKETLAQVQSKYGDTFGYSTADSLETSITWTMPLSKAKKLALDRGTKEALHIRELLTSYMGRRQLLLELRAGTLEYGIAAIPRPYSPPVVQTPVVPPIPESFVDNLSEEAQPTNEPPRQCKIPGL